MKSSPYQFSSMDRATQAWAETSIGGVALSISGMSLMRSALQCKYSARQVKHDLVSVTLCRPMYCIEQFSIECRKYSGIALVWLHWLLCDWSRKFAPLLNQIRCKTKTNRDFVTCVFPRLRPVKLVYFEFLLVACDINLCSDWPL